MARPSRTYKMIALGICLVLMNLGSYASAQTQPGESLTLSEAVDIALAKNPLTRVAVAERKIADAQLEVARAARWPLFQASETVTRSNNPVFVFGSLLEQGRFGAGNFQLDALNHPGALTNFRGAFTVRAPLFDQRQSRSRIDQAKLGQHQADQGTEQIGQQIRYDVIKSYYGVLLAQFRVEVSTEAINSGTADLQRIMDRLEAGLIVRSDLLAAQVQLAEFVQQRIQAAGDLATAQAALNTALGLPPDLAHTIGDQLRDRRFEIEPPEELNRLALEMRPEYARALLASQINARQVRGARDEMLPRVDAFATVGVSGRSPVTGSSDYAVGASITVNLFDAGRRARISEARANEALAQAQKDQLAGQISLEVFRAYHQFITARERLQVVGQTIGQAELVLLTVQNRYREGLTTTNEVLQAELALVRARNNVLNAQYDHYLAYAGVLLVTGRLKNVQPFVQ